MRVWRELVSRVQCGTAGRCMHWRNWALLQCARGAGLPLLTWYRHPAISRRKQNERGRKKLTLKLNLHLVDGPPPIDKCRGFRGAQCSIGSVHILYKCQNTGLEIALGFFFLRYSLSVSYLFVRSICANTVSAAGIGWWLRKVSVAVRKPVGDAPTGETLFGSR